MTLRLLYKALHMDIDTVVHVACHQHWVDVEYTYPHSQATPTSSHSLLAVCKYGGGRPGRFGHVQWHQVDTQGAVTNEGSQKPFHVMSVWGLDAREFTRQSLFTTLETGYMKCTIRHCPRVSTWHHHTWPDLPGLPPPYLNTANNEILEVVKAWNEDTVHTYSSRTFF